MKIECHCGASIPDHTDYLPNKGHVIPDQKWFDVLDAIDEAIERSGPSPQEKEVACMKVRSLIGSIARCVWVCQSCGRVYIDDRNYQLRCYVPTDATAGRDLFRCPPPEGE